MLSPRRIDFDLETYSECDLRQSGVFPYARHPSTDVLCAAWYDTQTKKKRLWIPGKPPPQDLFAAIEQGVKVHAHNCQFDAELWRWVLTPKYGWWWPGYDAFMCTQAIGQIYNLPGKLDLAAQFVTGVGKDQAGYQLMLKMCKPANATKASSDPKRLHTPERFKRLALYCIKDVRAETSFVSQIPYITPTEEKVWRRTYEMNLRGVQVDYTLVEKLLVIAEACQEHYRSLLYRETGGAVERETERAKLGRWLQLHGAKLPLTDKGNPSFSRANEHLVDMDGAQPCAREALRLYNLLNNSSLSKLTKLVSCRCEDDRVRGMTRYSGAGQTGRWAGQDVQLQNLPRGLFETEEEYTQALNIVEAGTTWDELELLYGGNALDVLSSLIRCCFIAKPGHKLLVADYAAVEGRVLAWLAGEKHVLDAYRDGKRLYAVAAAGIFGCSYEQVMREKDAGNSKKDKVGKTSELACIAAGSLVLTDEGYIPIEDVSPAHSVYDGIAFVSCGGVVGKGFRRIISYAGLTATPDHEVFTKTKGTLPFGLAAASGAHLRKLYARWQDLRLPPSDITRDTVRPSKLDGGVRSDGMHNLRSQVLGRSLQPEKTEQEQLRALPKTGAPQMATAANLRCEVPVLQPERPRLQELRRARHNIRLRECDGRMRLGRRELRRSRCPSLGNRPHRQQPWLYRRKLALGHTDGEQGQPASIRRHRQRLSMGQDCIPIRMGDNGAAASRRAIKSRYHRPRTSCRARQVQVLAHHCFAPVGAWTYDIVNAGPRHRFTADGVLVHNCGYGGSVGAFLQFGGHKFGLTEERMKEIIYAWRDSRPKTVQFWKDLGAAAIRAIENPRTPIRVGRVVFGYDERDLRIKLPSGRFLYLHKPRLGEKVWPDGGTTPQITYYGVDGQKAGWLTIYDGKFAGIITQATARDLLAHATLNVCEAGYKPVVTVHDELVCEEPEDGRTHEDLCALMSKLPDWAEGLPLNAEGFTTTRYRKG